MMKFYRVTDGSPDHDMFLVVYQSPRDKRKFPTAFAKALAAAKKQHPEEWDRDDVLLILQTDGWDVISPDYQTIYE